VDLARIDLPIVPYLPRISDTLETHRLLALTADPGAGKSTLVPPYLMDAAWMRGKAILMLEPRRLAAASVAARIADLLGEPLGKRAGYRVRAASHVSRETRVEVVTEALLTRRIQEDPLLEGVGLVIFDEFHERSIHADLALALSLEVRRARPDLALLLMSATLDGGRIALFLDSPSLACPGKAFPVETRHRAPPDRLRWEGHFAEGVASLFDDTDGDVLAFLPGAGEIRRAASRLEAGLRGRAEVLPLYGTLSLEDQRRVVAPRGEGRRRVILSTSIAETSLTVPGVRAVADCGWSRTARLHAASGLDRLVTERVSASSADQRRGRAGRTGPGTCLRFWPQSETLPSDTEPEILRTDLCGLVLECALWGARKPADLRWLDAPSPAGWQQAAEVLRMLSLLDASGKPTEAGRRTASLGLAPRLGALVLEGERRGEARLAAACAAVLVERDSSGVGADPDFRLRLAALRGGPASMAWKRNAEREAARILRRLGGVSDGKAGWTAGQEEGVGTLLARAFPDRIARREPDGRYRFVTGRVARFPDGERAAGGGPRREGNPVSAAAGGWVVAPEADAGEAEGTVRLAAPMDRICAERALVPVTVEETVVRWNGLVPKGWSVRRAGRLMLAERPCRPAAEAVTGAFLDRLAREGTSVLPWEEGTRGLLDRLRFFSRRRPGAGLGDLGAEAMTRTAGEWLAPYLDASGGPVITPGGLHEALEGMLGPSRAAFRRAVPESIGLPAGNRRRIDYSAEDPAVEARIQEVFGLSESPEVCGVPLTFRLLSPARRPLQITRDLAGFWKNTYAEVRGQMRGRYPKHYWPEDPLVAEAITGVRPRGR